MVTTTGAPQPRLYATNGDGNFTVPWVSTSFGPGTYKSFPVDVDDDGLPDLVVLMQGTSGPAQVFKNNKGVLSSTSQPVGGGILFFQWGDTQRVGRFSSKGGTVISNSTSAFIPSRDALTTSTLTDCFTAAGSGWMFADLNGDGYSDCVNVTSSSIWVPTQIKNNFSLGASASTTTFLWNPNSTTVSAPGAQVMALDVDGDGSDDLLQLGATTNRQNLVVQLSRQTSDPRQVQFTPVTLTIPGGGVFAALDMNGDGQMDFVVRDPSSGAGWGNLYVRNGRPADMLIGVVDGFGAATNVDYAPVSDSTVYSYSGDLTYPLARLKRGLWVVSKVHRTSGATTAAAIHDFKYSYRDGAIDVPYRGFLGFAQFIEEDLATGGKTTTSFDNSTPLGPAYPYAGRPACMLKTAAADTTRVHWAQTCNTYSILQADPAAPYAVYVSGTQTSEGEGAYKTGGGLPDPYRRLRNSSRGPTET